MGRIYLLGGTSNSGKSTCARELTQVHRLMHYEVDPIRGALQMALPPSDPINYFSTCDWLDLPPEESLRHKIDVASRTCAHGMGPLFRQVVDGDRDAIIEGDDLLPAFVGDWIGAGASSAAFLITVDPGLIRARYWDRDQTTCIGRDRVRLERFVPHYLGWASWVEGEATRCGLPVVSARNGDVIEPIARALGLV